MCIACTTAAAISEAIEEVVVTSQRREAPLLRQTGNIVRLNQGQLTDVRHQHLHELLTRVSGVWLSRGSGQENLAAIRSPVLTGAGSCGAFLTLEDGIPTRPAGFCNVNQLFELNSEQAAAIEVIRGPGNALYGSNALHGTINVLMPEPARDLPTRVALEAGSNEFIRVRGQLPFGQENPALLSLLYADDGGFRDQAGYRQGKLLAKMRTSLIGGELTSASSVTGLRQETASFILGQDAYKDSSVNRSNANPEAFRNASSQRLYAQWQRNHGAWRIDVRPYLRHSDMRFLQHFLPGQPLEENGHVSAGVISTTTLESAKQLLIVGADLEWSQVFLKETQFGPTAGSAFLIETRPEGKHYDFEVRSLSIAPFLQAEKTISDLLRLSAGLRVEHMRYDYDNRMIDGDTRDDGTPCGFGGCLYTRPGSRNNVFTNLAPNISLSFAASATSSLYVAANRGFRAPQMTELYRLQSGQQVADLDSEEIDSLELGLRVIRPKLTFDTSLFIMKKRNSIFRDADGFNVSSAKSRHDGIEAALDWQMHDHWQLSVDASYARHQYDFDRVAARGETFVSGRDVDTALRWLGNAELTFNPKNAFRFRLQWTMIGDYFLDAEN